MNRALRTNIVYVTWRDVREKFVLLPVGALRVPGFDLKFIRQEVRAGCTVRGSLHSRFVQVSIVLGVN